MKPTKREIEAARRAIDEQLDLIQDIRLQDGNREAAANATWPDTRQRMRGYIQTLLTAKADLPTRLVKDWAHYRAVGWHDHKTVPGA